MFISIIYFVNTSHSVNKFCGPCDRERERESSSTVETHHVSTQSEITVCILPKWQDISISTDSNFQDKDIANFYLEFPEVIYIL